MNESEFDTPGAREPPDYKVGSLALAVSRLADIAQKLRVDFEVFERIRVLTDEVHQAIVNRGARVGELADAIRDVRPMGSILMDLPVAREDRPTIPAKPRPPKEEPD